LGREDAELILFDDAGQHVLSRADKLTQARRLVIHIASLLK
jgi:phosphopantothenoylcysteine decarboxylase/phosphopantothenate--cysteine ligase